jgi:hypothetical protein
MSVHHLLTGTPRSGATLLLMLMLTLAFRCALAEESPSDSIQFNRDIRPLLSENCFFCHGPDARERQADLRLDTEAGLLSNRNGTVAIAPGKPAASELYRRVMSEDPDKRMPPPESGRGLSVAQKDLLRSWIAAGAEYQAHWSYVPPDRPPLPTVASASWPCTAIDRFVLARLEAAGTRPSPEADPVTLVRRLHLDLIGLPPAPDAVTRLVETTSPAAYDHLVDELLASPHFGERMAIYWLDLVRYADSVGYHGDQEHSATPYRDYVIDAFNQNKPFDQFTTEQLAGDLLPNATLEQRVASGYNRLLQTTHEGGAQDKEYLTKYAADRLRNVSTVWMGATMGCAECHDHKYDPYTQRDFYSLVAFFADIEEQGAYSSPNSIPTTRPPEILVLSPQDRTKDAQLGIEMELLRQALAAKKPAPTEAGAFLNAANTARLEELKVKRAHLRKRGRYTMVTVATEPRTIRVLHRGDWMDETGDVVEPAAPHFLRQIDAQGRRANRLDLARWLTSREHPQTARVLVNRLWYLFFGAGLSRILDDTGSQGEWPTHPALLDYLAVELVESGWDVKSLIRRLVLSSAYRQSSLESDEHRESDPANRLFGRQARQRLPAELVRDTALAVSDLLVREVGGGSARPYQPAGYYAHLNFPTRRYVSDSGRGQFRRGLYTHWQRQFLHPMLKAFDAPQREECTAERTVSNTPLAALTLLNDPSFVEAARALAELILERGGETIQDRAQWVWRRVLSRSPTSAEVESLLTLYRGELAVYQGNPNLAIELLGVGLTQPDRERNASELAAWTQVTRAILNLNETITRN